MYTYNMHQWLLFFYIYCFLGWVWESRYVSVRQKKWVNRGFLNGPFLPIYGSGAIAVLVSTLPFRPYPILVFFFGMLGATLLELVTGMAMESMFHVRYWDYSNQKFNFKGHICLTSSLAWGGFSVAMIYGFHKPIESLVLQLPQILQNLCAVVVTAGISADFALSFQAAMELRHILDSLERMREEVQRLQRRAEIVQTFLADELEQRSEEWKEKVLVYKEEALQYKDAKKEELLRELSELRGKESMYIEILKRRIQNNRAARALIKRNPMAASKRYMQAMKEFKGNVLYGLKFEVQEILEKAIDSAKERMEELRHTKS